MRLTPLILLLAASAVQTFSQFTEPTGGLYPTNLYFFQDEAKKGIVTYSWGSSGSVDKAVKRNGAASWRWDVADNSGVHIMWGGSNFDTTVFWAHDMSHLSFWVRPSNDNMRFHIQLGYMDGQIDIIETREIANASEWKYYDILVPTAALRRPLNEVKVMFHGSPGSVHFDDMKISAVRLYAGKGEPQSIKGVFADQLGYDTYGYKTFSAEKFKSYEVIRASDNKVVYTGNDSRYITHHAIEPYAVYTGNFTKFETPGKYFIKLDNGKKSRSFAIGSHVYDATLRAAVRFFYYQRNNTEIKMPYAEGPWVHAKDEKDLVLLPRLMGGTKYVRKGWHDAGDLAIYMPNNAYACFWLTLAWDDYRYSSDSLNIPESGNGAPDLLDELRWGLDWVLDMQDTTDGGFFHNMYVLPNSPYKYGSTTALTITGYQLTNKTTSATAAAAAALAYASTVFNEFDPVYAARLKHAATRGWKFLEANLQEIKITEGSTIYQDEDDIHARFFASAALYLSTGEEKYHNYFLAKDPGSSWISDFNNQTNLAYLLYLKSLKPNTKKQAELKNLLVGRAQEANADRDKHPFGFVGYYYWGSLGNAFSRVGTYNLLDWRVNKNLNSLFTALQQLHYTFGQNSLDFVYFSGFGENGMREGFHHWLETLNATPRDFPGMLAGGPNEKPDVNERNLQDGYNKTSNTPVDQRYTDNDSWSTNEIAVNQNAQLLYALCAAQAYARGRK